MKSSEVRLMPKLVAYHIELKIRIHLFKTSETRTCNQFRRSKYMSCYVAFIIFVNRFKSLGTFFFNEVETSLTSFTITRFPLMNLFYLPVTCTNAATHQFLILSTSRFRLVTLHLYFSHIRPILNDFLCLKG